MCLLRFLWPGLVALPAALWAQLSYTGGVVFQDFNSLPAAGGFSFAGKGPQALDAAPISAAGAAGWSLYANVGTPLVFAPDAGGATGAAVYAYGAPGSPERALGLLANSTRVSRAGLRLVNATGQTLTQVTLSYVGEVWRSGGTAQANTLTVDYRISATAFDLDSSATHTAVTALNFAPPTSYSQGTALNGNLPPNRALLSASVAVNWPPGSLLQIRWRDSDSAGDDDGLALDDVVFHAGPQAAAAPQVVTSQPVPGAVNVGTAARLAVVFDQPVAVAGTWAVLTDAASTPVPVSWAGGPLRYEITPASRLQPGTAYRLTILGAQVTADGGGTPMAADQVLDFTTQAAEVNAQRLSAVQGPGTATPLAGQVVTVMGVVTADFQGPPPALGGFFMQSLAGDEDADPATSEGVFVQDFTSEGSGEVAVGQVVRLTGTAGELGGLTQLSQVSALAVTGTAAVPAERAASLPQLTSSSLEPLEGMRVVFPQTLHVSSVSTSSGFALNYARQGELVLAAGGPLIEPTEVLDPNDEPASGTTTSGQSQVAAITAQLAAHPLQTLILDDASTALFPDPTPYLNAEGTRRCGDTVTGLSGVLSAAGGSYRLQPVGPVVFTDANPRPTAPPMVSGRLKVAAMNVLNYFTTFGGANDRGASDAAEFQRQKDKVIAALAGLDADVVGLMEIQNSAAAVADLLAALNAAVAEDYQVVPDPVGGYPAAGSGADFIRCVLLYRPSRCRLWGDCFMDAHPVWSSPSPLRFPLAQVFEENSTGERCIVCVNHWKSKSSSGATGLNADQGDGQGAFNELRRQQSARLHAWLLEVQAAAGERDVLIIGDLNAHGEEDPLDLLRANGWQDQGQRFHGAGDYSYRLDGLRGRLDHAFASSSMAGQVGGFGHWHINADEPAFYDYNMEGKSAAQLLINTGTPYRSSDHDPLLVGVSLSPQPTTYAMWRAARVWNPAALTGQGHDPDQDGLPNLAEFALNTNPEAATPPPQARHNGGELHFDFPCRLQLEGTTVLPEGSEDLVEWFTITNVTSLGSLDLRTEMRRASVPTSGRNRLFVRLRITSP